MKREQTQHKLESCLDGLKIKDSEGYALLGYRGKKNGDSGIVHCKYIPITIVETEEQRKERLWKERKGKTFAKVSLKHPDMRVRCKVGEVKACREDEVGVKRWCINIEKVNTCSEKGHMTWIGVGKYCYVDEWVEDSLISKVWMYDKDGNEVDVGRTFNGSSEGG